MIVIYQLAQNGQKFFKVGLVLGVVNYAGKVYAKIALYDRLFGGV